MGSLRTGKDKDVHEEQQDEDISSARTGKDKDVDEDQQDEDAGDGHVTSHLYLKPTHTTGTLDKAVVLRRIRHRKRINKVKSVVLTLLSSPFASAAEGNSSSAPQKRWVDDAFAAP